MSSVWDKYGAVIGVDPGFGCTGVVALTGNTGGEVLLIGAEAIVVNRGYRTQEERMSMIISEVIDFLDEDIAVDIPTSAFVIEDNHITGGRSAQTALKQRELIGALALGAWSRGANIVRVSAKSAKKALTGSGNSDKDAVVEVAREFDGFPENETKAKEQAIADALAVAMAGIEKLEKEMS